MSQKNHHNHDDQALLDLIITQQAGWRDMLSILLQRHHSAVLARCYAYLKNREDAEDATQETELRVFRAIKKFHGDASFRTWLFAIAIRQCHDMVSKRRKHVIDNHLRALIEIHEMNIAHLKVADENHAALNHALTRLPEKEREAIMLRYHMELSIQDIAATLDLGLSATKMRLYRALEKLSALVQAEELDICV